MSTSIQLKDVDIFYGDFKAVVDIQRLEVTEGKLPRRATGLVLDWAGPAEALRS